ncbi:MAG: hybrid sensor histidine kinase/response regulator [Parvularculaceae bacterium]|nr:hybrid sensor histidine kinase/response regulator [Parvularculaceae bacterium]
MPTLNVLVLEDDELDYNILVRHLETLRVPIYRLTRASTVDEAREAIFAQNFDAALIDYRLSSGMTGLDFVRELGGRQAPFPIILLTGMSDSDLDRDALLSGVYDYIDKLSLTRELADRAIRFAISGHRYERQLREAVAQAHEQAMINRKILSIVSHELKAPLSSQVALCDFLMEQYESAIATEAVTKVRACAFRQIDFLNNLSEFVRLESDAAKVHPETFNLSEMLAEVTDLFEPAARHKGVSIVLEIGDGADGEVFADRLRLRQVMINLVKNAVQYSDDGAITVSARRIDEGLRLEVRDEGDGIPKDKIAMILSHQTIRPRPGEDFDGGLGIGLSICRRLISLMGGVFTIESARGAGVAAIATLPLGCGENEEAA